MKILLILKYSSFNTTDIQNEKITEFIKINATNSQLRSLFIVITTVEIVGIQIGMERHLISLECEASTHILITIFSGSHSQNM